MQRGGGEVVTYDELKAELENTPMKLGAVEFIKAMGATSFDKFKENAQKIVGQENTVNIQKIKNNFFEDATSAANYPNARTVLLTLLSK